MGLELGVSFPWKETDMKRSCVFICLCLACQVGSGPPQATGTSLQYQQPKLQVPEKPAANVSPELKPAAIRRVPLPTPRTEELTFRLGPGESFYYHDFRTLSRGRITIDISYPGEERLEALLLPPGEQTEPVVRKSGVKRLRLQTDIDPAWMKAGEKWTVYIRPAESGVQLQTPLKATRLQSPQKVLLSGTVRVTYPALVKLRPSPYVPILVSWVRQAVEGKGNREWRELLVRYPQLKPRLQSLVRLYDTLPAKAKADLYAGPYLKQGASALRKPAFRSSALDAQVSASLGVQTLVAPRPVPRITGIYPEMPLANDGVVVAGENFIYPGKTTAVLLERKSADGRSQSLPLVMNTTLILKNHWARIELPANVGEIDRYKVTVSHPGGTATTEFEAYASAHQVQRYTGRINSVTCVDESNPESPNWLVGSDEVYAIIAVLRTERKTPSDWEIQTSTKGGFDDGDSKEVNWRFFDSRGLPATLGDGVLVSVLLFEDDPGGPPSEVQDLVRVALKEAARNIALWEGAQGLPFSSLLATLWSDILGGFLDLIFSALEDDFLGVQSYYFDARQLYDWTRKEGGVFRRSFIFNNDGDTGSYRTQYEWKFR
jgi:hypothetical protein